MLNFSPLKLSLVTLLVTISTVSFAQTSSTSYQRPLWDSIFITPSLGVIFTDFRINNNSQETSTKAEPGIILGLDVLYRSNNPYWDLVSGLYYSQSRTQVDFKETRIDAASNVTYRSFSSDTYEMQRLSLPLLVKVFPFTKSSNFYMKAGSMIHHQMRVSYSGFYETNTFSTNQNGQVSGNTIERESYDRSLDGSDGLRSFVFDAVIGAGYTFDITRNFSLLTEATYQVGLNGLVNADNNLKADTAFLTFGLIF